MWGETGAVLEQPSSKTGLQRGSGGQALPAQARHRCPVARGAQRCRTSGRASPLGPCPGDEPGAPQPPWSPSPGPLVLPGSPELSQSLPSPSQCPRACPSQPSVALTPLSQSERVSLMTHQLPGRPAAPTAPCWTRPPGAARCIPSRSQCPPSASPVPSIHSPLTRAAHFSQNTPAQSCLCF